MNLAPGMRRRLGVALASVVIALCLRASGGLQQWELDAGDLRSRVLRHEVPSDIVIVGIDSRSLAEINRWPWPRRNHAQLIDQIATATPQRLFFDIDFSTASNPVDDELLEKSLERWHGTPILLPAFFQNASGSDEEVFYTQPLPSLARHAQLASVNLQPSVDALVRSVPAQWNSANGDLKSAFNTVAARPLDADTQVDIDYSISPASFEFISYTDLLHNRVSADELKNKIVMVGATAVELGDMQPVPAYRSLPGVVVQALAAQTVRSGLLRRLPMSIYAPWMFVVAAASGALIQRRRWRRNAAITISTIAFIAFASLIAQRFSHISLEVIPLAISAIATFLIVTLRSLDEQTLRSMTFALLVGKRDALLKSVVESSSDCILCIDSSGRVQTVNAAAAELFGYSREQLLASTIDAFLPDLLPTQGGDDRLADVKGRITEHYARTQDSVSFPVEISISPVNHKDERLYTVIVRDIRERKAQEEKLQHQATHDALTGLPNRHLLALELEREIEFSSTERTVGLLVLDLTRFKEVNDTLGHNFGDVVLREVARRFQSVVSGKGLIARMGGDEFTVLCPRYASDAELASLAQRLSDALRTPIIADAVAIEIGVNIGIACFPRHAKDSQTLLKNADVAMYSAKRAGHPYAFYDAALDEHSVRKLAILAELRSALETSALQLHFQPQINLRTRRVESVEALLRWQHPRFGAMSPMEFITVAESTDLVRPLTEWTIIEALTQLRRWDDAGIEVRVAVNLSARMLQDLLFPRRLANLLAVHQVRPGALELEITESAMMIDSQRAREVVTGIHDLGVYVSIDDYGTGFSSLAYLRDLPVHALKLDRSFLSDLQTRENNRVIVESTVTMAHALKLQVVAEGVETEWQENYLAAAGYDFGQGYRYGKAMAADECRDWMLARNAAHEAIATDEVAQQILLQGRG